MQLLKPLVAAPRKNFISLMLTASLFVSTCSAYAGDETTYYFLTDHLGSIDVVTDDQGEVVERRDFLPYGAERLTNSTPDSTGTDHKFTGKELDDETGLYYYGARYYDPLIGQFLAPDPWQGDLSNPQTLNKYSYVLNNPLTFVDPTGMYNMKTGDVEKGDTLGAITSELNGYFGTKYSYSDIAKINGISDPNKIEIGQSVKMGTVSSNGSTWTRAYDSDEVTLDYWQGLSKNQQMITHMGRNLFQDGDLPPTEAFAIASGNFNSLGEAVAHNLGIGVFGNKDYRGNGPAQGQQAVYGAGGQLVTSAENRGTFDFGRPGTRAHKTMDVIPWIAWGNSPQDKGSPNQRYSVLEGLINASDWADYYNLPY